MSVLRSRRGIAFSEFERNMWKIHRDLENRMHGIPARYKKHVCDKLYEPMNRAYNALIIANEQKGGSYAAKEKRQKYFKIAITALMQMEKPMLCFCNIREMETAGLNQIEKSMNYEIALVCGAAGWDKGMKPVFHVLRKEKFKKLAFLGKMGDLHRYTFQKTVHAPNDAFDSLSTRINDFATNALYGVVMANIKEPETKEEAQRRDAWLKDAIDNLNAMQRPMVGLWNIMQYSEAVMDEWAGMIDEELRILAGLREADRKRYSSLK